MHMIRFLLLVLPCIALAASLSTDDDPLLDLRIVTPGDGSVATLPVVVRLGLSVASVEAFEARYQHKHVCVELNGVWKSCKTADSPPVFTSLPEDNYTARVFVTDELGASRSHESTGVSFAVLSPEAFKRHTEKLLEESRVTQKFPKDIDLISWAEQQDRHPHQDANRVANSPMLVIGIKTAVVTGFPRRQAIRETWANTATLPADVKVLFLGCEPDVSNLQNATDRARIFHAVNKERAVYADLLTEELTCTDSYQELSDKVRSFMRLAAAEFPRTKFVMLADDDIYLKIGRLADYLRTEAPQERLYFGEVWAEKYAHKQKPFRDANSKYHLPTALYPVSTLLPYASGPHYVVSMDCVRFVAKNYWRLKSMNGLEDVSTGMWMLQMGVRARHVAAFSSIRDSGVCEEDLVSFADLSTLGIRSLHANVLGNRSFCHGFHPVTWQRSSNTLPTVEEMLKRDGPSS